MFSGRWTPHAETPMVLHSQGAESKCKLAPHLVDLISLASPICSLGSQDWWGLGTLCCLLYFLAFAHALWPSRNVLPSLFCLGFYMSLKLISVHHPLCEAFPAFPLTTRNCPRVLTEPSPSTVALMWLAAPTTLSLQLCPGSLSFWTVQSWA